MTTPHCLRILGVLMCFVAMTGCSNGRGSVEERPPTAAAEGELTIGATVSGLAGSGLVLQNNGSSNLSVTTNGSVVFATSLASGAPYSVTVLTQPANPSQACTVANGSGTVTGNVTNVTVTCSNTPGANAFPVSGRVTGLTGSGLVLQNNAGDDLAVPSDGIFTFATSVASGATYNVTVATQPTNPAQICTLVNASGTVGTAEITDVAVTCATNVFEIGGTVSGLRTSGLAASGLVLQNNGTDDLRTGEGPFVFSKSLATGAPYNVTVKEQPLGQNCTVANSSGTIGAADVTDVTVTCAANLYVISGAITGLSGSPSPGAEVILQLNGGQDKVVRSNGTFAFENGLTTGTPYEVKVKTQPTNPSQTCTIANASGVVADANIQVTITCTTNSFAIAGTVTGLAGQGLTLQLNGSNDLAVASNGSFSFATPVPSGSAYEVTVRTNPLTPSQTCTVEQGSGTVGAGDVRNVRVTCATVSFPISATVSGLLGDRVILQNNGGDDVEVAASGAFTFQARVASGGTYNVTVSTQPSNPTQACTVANGSGTVGNAPVTNITVSCTTSSFMIGGSVTGLNGSGLMLRNNGGDDLAVNASGAFNFATPISSGATYSVTVAAQPTNPAQLCTVTNGSGTVGGSNIANIAINCVNTEFRVAVAVTGLAGAGLVLQNNGADNLAIATNGSFPFPASLQNGTPYSVTVLTQPTNPSQTCTVSNGSGTISGADVSVAVNCTTNTYTVGGTITGLASLTGMVLQNNGADSLFVLTSGTFTFNTPLASGTTYNVTVASQPTFPPQNCTVANGSGTVVDANVISVAVSCGSD